MKWIEVFKANKLRFNQEVFVKMSDGEYGYGILVKKEETAEGAIRTFNLATFGEKTRQVTNVTHIIIPPNE